MAGARKLTGGETASKTVTFGVVGTGDPRIDAASRQRAANIVEIVADQVAANVRMPDGTPVDVVWTPLLVDGEKQADIVGRMFREAGVDAVICTPDTWAFPQLTLMSLLAHLPADMPVNITCGNSGPKPGVVYAHAVNGALAQSGRLTHLNVGTWPDTGLHPQPTDSTVEGAGRLVLRRADLRRAQGAARGGLRARFDGHGDGPGPRHPHAADVRPGNHPAGHEAAGRHARQGRVRQAGTCAAAGVDRPARGQAARPEPATGRREVQPVAGACT